MLPGLSQSQHNGLHAWGELLIFVSFLFLDGKKSSYGIYTEIRGLLHAEALISNN